MSATCYITVQVDESKERASPGPERDGQMSGYRAMSPLSEVEYTALKADFAGNGVRMSRGELAQDDLEAMARVTDWMEGFVPAFARTVNEILDGYAACPSS